MAQTLAVLPASTSPATRTQANALMAQMQTLQNLNIAQLNAIAGVSLTYLVNSAGGTDYRSNHKQAIADAVTFMDGHGAMQAVDASRNFLLINTVLLWQFARDSDATISADVNTLLSQGRDFAELPLDLQFRLMLFLQYRLIL